MSVVVVPSVEMRGILAGLASGCTGSGSSSSSSAGVCTGRLCNLTLRLWLNDVQPTVNFSWADLVECTFDGYAPRFPVSWNQPYTDALGVSQLFGGCYQFTVTGNVTSNQVFGWALTREDGGTVLVALSRFDTIQNANAAGQAIIAEPYFPLTTPGQ